MRAQVKIRAFVQGFLTLNVLWYLAALLLRMRLLPLPTVVYAHMGNLVRDNLHLHLLVSLYRIGSGLALALLIGISVGLIMAYSKPGNAVLNPLVYLTYPIPKTALLPVVMLLFGLGDTSKITLIVLILVFQVIVAVRDSVLNIPQEAYDHIRSLGASRFQIFWHITLPAILPALLTNLRLSLGTALSILFFAEGYGTRFGIGYYILDAWTRIDYLDMYAGIVAISLLGFLLFVAVDAVEARLCAWKR